jgi:hypothetical protein
VASGRSPVNLSALCKLQTGCTELKRAGTAAAAAAYHKRWPEMDCSVDYDQSAATQWPRLGQLTDIRLRRSIHYNDHLHFDDYDVSCQAPAMAMLS